MTKFVDQNEVEEKRNLLNGKVTCSADCFNRQELVASIQEYIMACHWLSINPLEMLRKLFPAFRWLRVDPPQKEGLDAEIGQWKEILNDADYFWENDSDGNVFVARREDSTDPSWKIFGSLCYQHNMEGEDHWNKDNHHVHVDCQQLKSAGAVHCPD